MARHRSASPDRYEAVTLRVSDAEEELAVAALWARGTLGLEIRTADACSLVTAYFEAGRSAAEGWQPEGEGPGCGSCRVVSIEALEDRDWLESYRRRARPFALGRRFWVNPGDQTELGAGGEARPAPDGRTALILPARRAFGTGTHESTRLAVELLESQDLNGRSVLDVGSGSGILAFAAAALGAARVVALEVDPVAALTAAQNQVANDLTFALYSGRVSALRGEARFDRIVINVIPELIADDLPEIARRLEPRGRAIVSGFLGERAAEYERELADLGLMVTEARRLREWGAFLLAPQGGRPA